MSRFNRASQTQNFPTSNVTHDICWIGAVWCWCADRTSNKKQRCKTKLQLTASETRPRKEKNQAPCLFLLLNVHTNMILVRCSQPNNKTTLKKWPPPKSGDFGAVETRERLYLENSTVPASCSDLGIFCGWYRRLYLGCVSSERITAVFSFFAFFSFWRTKTSPHKTTRALVINVATR